MNQKKTLQEELNRMKLLSGIISEANLQQTQQTPQSQKVQKQQTSQPQQTNQPPVADLDPSKADQAMTKGMDELIKNLPNILMNFTATVGDKDKQLDTGDEKTQPQQAQKNQKTAQTNQVNQANTAPIQEIKKRRELIFDEDKYNSQYKELHEAGLIGLVASAPAIMQLGGKLLQKLGSKTNPNIIQKMGKVVANAGEKMHHKYLSVIEKIIAPFMPNATPESKKKAAEALFVILVSGLFAGGLSNPDFLSGVKGKEIAEYITKIIPTTMTSVGFA